MGLGLDDRGIALYMFPVTGMEVGEDGVSRGILVLGLWVGFCSLWSWRCK